MDVSAAHIWMIEHEKRPIGVGPTEHIRISVSFDDTECSTWKEQLLFGAHFIREIEWLSG